MIPLQWTNVDMNNSCQFALVANTLLTDKRRNDEFRIFSMNDLPIHVRVRIYLLISRAVDLPAAVTTSGTFIADVTSYNYKAKNYHTLATTSTTTTTSNTTAATATTTTSTNYFNTYYYYYYYYYYFYYYYYYY